MFLPVSYTHLHLNIYVKQLVEKEDIPIPIYVLPPRMYGNMEIKEIYQDACDLIQMFQETHQNPVQMCIRDRH